MTDALRVVAREQLRNVQPWRAPDVQPPTPPPPPAAPPAPPTVAALDAIRQHARDEGYAQGLAEGRRAARGELEQQQAWLRALCDALARPLADVDVAVERQLAELAMLVARGAVQAELHLHPEHLLHIVRKAIGALPAATTQVEVVVHPQSATLLRDGLDEATERGWRITEDPSLRPGDCRILGVDSRIDGRIATRLQAMIDAALGDDAQPVADAADVKVPA